jgi:enterochelin esterase-like enzyme
MSVSKKKIGIALSLITCAVLAVLALGPAGPATASAPAKPMAMPANAPIVNADGTVTFSLKVPGATHVYLNFQNMIGLSPRYNSYPMTADANGVWSITLGPTVPGLLGWTNPPAPLTSNWYGYGFNIDGTPPVVPPVNPTGSTTVTSDGGVNIADPANRDVWSGDTSAWSMVMVPGPGTEYMADDPAVPHGAWGTVRYFSKVTQTERQMQVYTPPGYNHDNRRYPVFYLQHGGGGNDTDWLVNMRANYILDNLVAQGKAVPMILVMPDFNVGGSTGVSEDLYPQELLGTIIPYMEENYRVAPGAQNRALAGLSAGGDRVRNTLFQHPDAFAYIGLFSGGTLPQADRDDLVQNHPDLITNMANSKVTKLFWISFGGLEYVISNKWKNLAATLAFFDQYHIRYTYEDGPTFGAIYGHVWDTWRKDLVTVAPQLFK